MSSFQRKKKKLKNRMSIIKVPRQQMLILIPKKHEGAYLSTKSTKSDLNEISSRASIPIKLAST